MSSSSIESFDELVAKHDAGLTNTELSRELREMVEYLNERARQGHKAKGEIGAKFILEAVGGGRVEIRFQSSVKRPGPPRTQEIRWVGDKGALVASDPRQKKMPFAEVPPPTPIRARKED